MSSHRRYKGHCLLCAYSAWEPRIKGNGRRKFPPRVARALGRKRRFGNVDLSQD